jgi:cell division protein FtsB
MLLDSEMPVDKESELKEKLEALNEQNSALKAEVNKLTSEAKKYLTRIKTIEWDNRNLK